MSDWQPIEGWPHYEVSQSGEVRKITGEAVGQWPNDQGYMMVRLSAPRRLRRVHRLVAAAFVPNPNELSTVNHINNDRADNRAGNLEWCTQAENIRHADSQGRMRRDYWTGARSPNAALSDEQVRQIRSTYASGGPSLQSLADQFGISKRAIHRCVKRETYPDVQ